MITINQTIELTILVKSMMQTLTEGIEGTAKVAKAIQVYLSCTFSEAVSYLSIIIEELSII